MPTLGDAVRVHDFVPRELRLVAVLAAAVPKELVHTLVKRLGSAAPVDDLRHLKRVRKSAGGSPDHLDVLLCKVGSADAPSADPILNAVQQLVSELSLTPFETQVPSQPPNTREAWEEWNKIWPMSWRIPDKKTTASEPIPGETQDYFKGCMRDLLGRARVGGAANAALIMNPVSGRQIAFGRDESGTHPLDHAAMVAIKRASLAKKLISGSGGTDLKTAGCVGRIAERQDLASGPSDQITPLVDMPAEGQVAETQGGSTERIRDVVMQETCIKEIDGIDSACQLDYRISSEPRCEAKGLATHTTTDPSFQPESSLANQHSGDAYKLHHNSTGAEMVVEINDLVRNKSPGERSESAENLISKLKNINSSQAEGISNGSHCTCKEACSCTGTCRCNKAAATVIDAEDSRVTRNDLTSTSDHGYPVDLEAARSQHKRQRVEEISDPDQDASQPYMCTGYDCFLLREPCIMCAMALVHSRMARVIYCVADPDHGALGSKHKLHGCKSLNHHYEVYHLPVEGDSA